MFTFFNRTKSKISLFNHPGYITATINNGGRYAPCSPRPRPTARIVLPNRFDIHQIESFNDWVVDQSILLSRRAVADASTVAFIDTAAIKALVEARAQLFNRGVSLRIENPAPAALAIFELASVTSTLGLDHQATTNGARS